MTKMIRELIQKNRSYRRFDHTEKIPEARIREWIELARFSASGRNMQPLKYVICTDEETNARIFTHLGWAGYLSKWKGPEENERPVAYVVVLHDKNIASGYFCDDGIAMQSILLGATADGFGGCIVGSVNKSKVSAILGLPEHLEILWIVALGKPAETVVLEEAAGNEIRYYRDDSDVHHVPKRPLNEIIYLVK